MSVALAVVPHGLQRTLPGALAGYDACTVVQHGYAHANHAAPPARAMELGARPLHDVLEELAAGAATLRDAFGPRFAPVLVPPWNRVDPAVAPRLRALGLAGLSTFGPRAQRFAAPGVMQCNTHADPIAWRDGRRFVGAQAACAAVVAHLAARRAGTVDADEPTGLLTHHLVFDADAWRFVDDLLARTLAHPAARWLDVAQAFAVPTRDRPA